MNQTELRWIEIADERHFRQEAMSERADMLNLFAQQPPTAGRCMPALRAAISALPSRVLSALHIRFPGLHNQ
jgi:hypothetical protein